MKALGTWRLGRVFFEMLETVSFVYISQNSVFLSIYVFLCFGVHGTQSWHGFGGGIFSRKSMHQDLIYLIYSYAYK